MNSQGPVLDSALETYMQNESLLKVARAAARVEASGYMKWTRVEDTMEFAHQMGYETLGIASCVGLKREAAILESVLRENGFLVVSAICKTGGVSKETIGVKDGEKVTPGSFESMCNPRGSGNASRRRRVAVQHRRGTLRGPRFPLLRNL